MPVARNAAARASAHLRWAERYNRTSDTVQKALAHFGRALDYELAFGTMSDKTDGDFRIDIETEPGTGYSEFTAECVYTGRDDALGRYLGEIQLNPRSLVYVKIVLFPTERVYQYTNTKYRGKITHFWNSLTMYKDRLEQGRRGFPVLEKLTGIGRGMLVACICKALDEGLIDISSNIVLEATSVGATGNMDREESTRRLVSYYEGIGFTKLFHGMYDADVRKNSVAMVAKVEDIIARFDIGSLSPGILDVSQIQRCKGRLYAAQTKNSGAQKRGPDEPD